MHGETQSIHDTPVRVVIISMDRHLAGAVDAARADLVRALPNLTINYHAAADWDRDPDALAACRADVAAADIIVAAMLFLESQFEPIKDALAARAPHCDAIVGCVSASEIVRLTRLGRFQMDKPETGVIAMLKRLRGGGDKAKSGARQVKMLRRLPKLLKYIPGTAQDVRAYFLTMQYWLAGSKDNVANLTLYLIDRYASGPRAQLRGSLNAAPPAEYPEVGVYHPRMRPPIAETTRRLPFARSARPTVGLLIMRSYTLAEDAAHYDGVIAALEARGLKVIPAFASGLDARPAVKQYFFKNDAPAVDAVVSLTGFSLVGGPAYNDANAAVDLLTELDVPYICAHALEFQTLEQWRGGSRGLSPVESTIMVAIPELDGAAGAAVFGGRADGGAQCSGCSRRCKADANGGRAMIACAERVDALAARVEKLVRLRRKKPSERRIAITLFNFPPNGGAVGSAANLAVFPSLFNVLKAMKAEGYRIALPESADALREALLVGNSAQYGTDANVCARVPVDDHVRGETRLEAIEAQWGPAPGRIGADGRAIYVCGLDLGEVFVGVQPSFGYEGDPMRLLFEGGFAPTHAFAAYYRYVRETFDADAVLHFGTHGALEFMPGKQTGLTDDCWPEHLIGDLPNYYYYAANNPSEAAIAKRRSAATTISYLTPPLARADLYKELADLNATIERRRMTPPDDAATRADLAELAQAQAARLELAPLEPAWGGDVDAQIDALRDRLREFEETLIPHGLHVAGEPPNAAARAEMLAAVAGALREGDVQHQAIAAVEGDTLSRAIDALVAGAEPAEAARVADAPTLTPTLTRLAETNERLAEEPEIPALLHALNGGFTPPVAGGDLLRTTDILPTGRNIHGFDPFRLPSAFALADGARQADRLLARHEADAGAPPETVAVVLWGTDNLKSEGAQLAQALALMGARPRFDGYGRLTGAELIPLEALGRPRIDVVATLSGIFRDLLPLQTKLLAEAAFAAASADEPETHNFVRKHALAYVAAHGCNFETAALRVFSNADGAYGANVNQLIDSGLWQDEDDLADAYTKRKCFAYGRSGEPSREPALLESILTDVDLAYQNLDSVELGVTTIDHYFDTLGGVGRAIRKAKGEDAPVYISDQTVGAGTVRTLSEQVALETRTRTLNPKWYEGMLQHGYEGVRQIEAHVTNTMGWSATTGAVAPWVYEKISETYVLDEALRERMTNLNPKSCAKLANRLLEASDRQYWSPDAETLEALRRAGEEIEDRMEGVVANATA